LTLGNAEASPLADTDGNASALTRDGEMSLNVVPVLLDGKERLFLDGTRLNTIPDWQMDEMINMHTVPVPNSWKRYLPDDEEGIIYLSMTPDTVGGWRSPDEGFSYQIDFGLEKEEK